MEDFFNYALLFFIASIPITLIVLTVWAKSWPEEGDELRCEISATLSIMSARLREQTHVLDEILYELKSMNEDSVQNIIQEYLHKGEAKNKHYDEIYQEQLPIKRGRGRPKRVKDDL